MFGESFLFSCSDDQIEKIIALLETSQKYMNTAGKQKVWAKIKRKSVNSPYLHVEFPFFMNSLTELRAHLNYLSQGTENKGVIVQ